MQRAAPLVARSRRRLELLAVAVMLGSCLLASPARAATPPDLSGEWFDHSQRGGTFDLNPSADRKTLTATWRGPPAHATVVGSFRGTLNGAGTGYTGSMHVQEGDVSANGTMTFKISSDTGDFGYPLLNVSYSQDNNVSGSFTLEIWLLPLRVAPSEKPAVRFGTTCPSEEECSGTAAISDFAASAEKPVAPAARRGKRRLVGSVHFSIQPGGTKRITVPLNKRGRRLLAKRGRLRVRLRVRMNKSSGLRRSTNLGVVTLRK